MPIPLIKQNKEKRQKLLECAIELFVEKGYYDTPVREIILRSGFGTGTFYNYFINKEDILKTIMEEFADLIISGVNNYLSVEKDLHKRFIGQKRAVLEVFTQNEKQSEIYSRVIGSGDVINDCLKQFDDRVIDFYTRSIEYGIKKNVFKNVPVPPVANAMLAVDKYLLYRWIVLKAITRDEMIEMDISFSTTLSKGLAKEKQG